MQFIVHIVKFVIFVFESQVSKISPICCIIYRHGAHNWEGPGALTALTALRALAQLTALHSWLQHKSSPDFVVFAGWSVAYKHEVTDICK